VLSIRLVRRENCYLRERWYPLSRQQSMRLPLLTIEALYFSNEKAFLNRELRKAVFFSLARSPSKPNRLS